MKVEFDLLTNALDSIDHAMELVAWNEEPSEPRRLKQAVQSIAHGIELLLKERLRQVHPSLIWENVEKYPSLNARTVTAEGAITRLASIGGLKFKEEDLELVRSLRATRNAIEHFRWTTTKQEADTIIGRALAFAIQFSANELNYEFFGYASRKDDSYNALLSANTVLAEEIQRRQSSSSIRRPEACNFCRATAVDPVTRACRLCGHWSVKRVPDEDIPF